VRILAQGSSFSPRRHGNTERNGTADERRWTPMKNSEREGQVGPPGRSNTWGTVHARQLLCLFFTSAFVGRQRRFLNRTPSPCLRVSVVTSLLTAARWHSDCR